MQNKEVLNIIEKFSSGKKKYEEKKGKKLGHVSLYDYILFKVDVSCQQLITLNKKKIPSQLQINSLLDYYQSGQYDEAEKLALIITELFPDHQLSWKVLGALLNQTGRLLESVVASSKSIAINFEDAEAHSNLGATFKELGRLEEAEISFRQAIKLQPDFVQAYTNLGVVLQLLGKLEEAEVSYRKAIKLKPNYAELYCNLGNVLKNLLRPEEAEVSYRKAISFKPDYPEAYNNLGNILKDLLRLEEAEVSYKKAIALKADFAEAHNNLGIALKEQLKLQDAESSYRKAIFLKLDYPEAHNNLGVILKEKFRPEEAEVSFRHAIALKPEYTEAHSNLGVSLQVMGRLKEAEVSYRKAIELKPDYAEAYSNLGNMLKELGRFGESIENFKKFIKINPNSLEVKHVLASLTGAASDNAPRIYVENLFDGYADKFDHSLVDKLEYKIPKIIGEMIIKTNIDNTLGSVLDLGCGTGLAGMEIKDFCVNLEGIDLSNLMLEKAKSKNIYDKLTHIDIVEYLLTANLNFDYFISTDVFIYVGDLYDIFRLIKSRNKSPGKLVFSTEHSDKEGFFLQKSTRYSHSKKYIENLCKVFNYKLSYFETVNLRKEKDQFITGGLYLLDF